MADERNILSVSELNARSREILEGLFPLGVWVRAEIRNLKAHSSGHLYFALTDQESAVDGVMWRSAAQSLGFKLEEGMKVEALGSPTLYEKTGRYQFSVRRLIPIGEGARAVAFRQLKQKLLEEGLFSQERKRRLPAFPFSIGVVTSPTGAAIRDIINVVRRRAPFVTLVVRAARVQGEGAAEDIAAGIEELNSWGGVELIIVGRGGGSEDDLWCFNDENLARTIFASRLPVISAVGHEVDFTISDFVSDLRAPTPSAAAELAVREIRELRGGILGALKASAVRCSSLVEGAKIRLLSDMRRAGWSAPIRRIRDAEQRIDELKSRAERTQLGILERGSHRLIRDAQKLESLGVKNTLKRGFTVVYRDGRAVESAQDLLSSNEIDIQFRDGLKRAVIK